MNQYQPDLFESSNNQISNSLDDSRDILITVLALNSIKGVGQKTIQTIYDLGLISRIWELNEKELGESLKTIGRNKNHLIETVLKNRKELLTKGEEAANSLQEKGVCFLSVKDNKFPNKLQKMKNTPRWLFVKGNLEALLSESIIGIVGTRKATQEGKIAAYHLAKEFVFQNIVVLSGLAEGIDTHAHQGAVKYYGQTIGILGHGFDAIYISKNKQLWDEILAREGVIISEYLPNESPSRENFLRRNEIQVALSNLIIPIEVPDLASGTGATIRRALAQKTPLIGINIDKRESPTLNQTTENLKSLGIPVFSLPGEQEKFWALIHNILPYHKWDIGPRERQKRFVNSLFGRMVIIDDFAEELKKASFSKDDIAWLAKELIERMG